MDCKDSSSISVIVPVYDDPTGLRNTLESILNQTHSPVEIIVGVTPADGETLEIANQFAEEYPKSVSIVTETTTGPAAGRNAAIESSSGEVLAFLDSNMVVNEDYVKSGVHRMTRREINYMGCDVQLTIPNSDTTVAARYDRHTGFPMEEYIAEQHYAPTCALFVRRNVFRDVGLFDPRLKSGEDLEFGNRVANEGYELDFAPDITAYHPVRDSLSALLKKDRRVGRGLCQLQRYHPERFGTPGVPPRPSGIKRPNPDLPLHDRLAFGALSRLGTAARGVGYYREYLTGERRDDLGSVPQLKE